MRVVDRDLVDLSSKRDGDGREAEVDDVARHPARSGDRELGCGLGVQPRIGRVVGDLLATRVELRFVAERQHVHAAAVENRCAGGGRRAGANGVGRLAAAVRHLSDVGDRDRRAGRDRARPARVQDGERTTAQRVVDVVHERDSAHDDLEEARRDLVDRDRHRPAARDPVEGLAHVVLVVRRGVGDHVILGVKLQDVAGAKDRLAVDHGLAAVVDPLVGRVLLRSTLDHERDLDHAPGVAAARRHAASELHAARNRRPLARVELVDLRAVVDDDRDEVAVQDRHTGRERHRRAGEQRAPREGDDRR